MSSYFAIAFGLIAWIVPITALFRRKYGVLAAWGSLIPCAASLVMWVAAQLQMAYHSDWSGIYDTAPTGLKVCVILVALTVILNACAYLRGKASHRNTAIVPNVPQQNAPTHERNNTSKDALNNTPFDPTHNGIKD